MEEREEIIGIIDGVCERHDFSDEELGEIRKVRDYVFANNASNTDISDSDGVKWRDKYTEMKKRYHDRFFSTPSETKADQREDIEKDDNSTTVSFNDLFSKRESDYKI